MPKKSKRKGKTVSSTPSFDGLMDSYTDEVGRMFCTEHGRDYCHVCCVDYRMGNRVQEEAAGLRKKDEVEDAARMYATCLRALRGMERMHPRPSEEIFAQNRQWRDEQKALLDKFAEEGHDVAPVIQKAIVREESDELEMNAMTEQMARMNPGQTHFEIGGEESQKIYDEFIRPPKTKSTRGDYFTCAYCGKTSDKKLLMCSRCKTYSYCGRECQKAAWPAHKKNECVKKETEAKKAKLTWEQVEAHGGMPAPGTLEVKAISDESYFVRQVFQCRDRVGICRRIAAYTNSQKIPGLRVGATVQWKKPRFHYFTDGSSGARIEEEDLENIVVK
uniref:MYND-type domain-containing protein n=1 Tax=Ditylum brightwellii TaxID=49249 RepID=A0A7S4ULF1_9STRA|mmetsp:Transcript_22913/g.34519  ORF Transcript_22913/g.34519 Transcript_22913/m.34519 type:complete len:332 (+) Transcript_22913:201-1196(+)